jgi:hypothetical protein
MGNEKLKGQSYVSSHQEENCHCIPKTKPSLEQGFQQKSSLGQHFSGYCQTSASCEE